MEEKRRLQEKYEQKIQTQRALRDRLTRILDVDYRWWGDAEPDFDPEDAAEDEDEDSVKEDIFVS